MAWESKEGSTTGNLEKDIWEIIMKRRVAITGMGITCPIGNSVKEVMESVRDGKCGIAPITHYDTTDRIVTLAGEIKNLNMDEYIPPKEQRKLDKYAQYAIVAATQAMNDSGLLDTDEERDRWGTIISSGIGGIKSIEDNQMVGSKRGFDKVTPFYIPMAISNMAAGNVAILFGLKGFCSATVTACASAANAIGDGFRQIRDGYADVMLCGGSEAAITPLSIGGFTSMKALSHSKDPARASIPFDKERSGFVMGEGAGILVLEDYDHATARGAHIYGEVAGYGANCDAYHITSPCPDGSGAAKCMRLAIQDAGLKPEDIDYVNAHGTSTVINDKGESAAIKAVFGDHAASGTQGGPESRKLKVSSTKSMTGHMLGASAAAEAVITVKALEDSFVPPTVGYKVPDEECDLDYVPNRGYEYHMTYAISNSFGFGGHNATLVFKKAAE